MDTAERILEILDAAADAFTFPMLDNGYVYPAAARLPLFRSASDWAMVIETFGFSPRAGFPDTTISTFASKLERHKTAESFISRDASDRYLRGNPNNEMSTIFTLDMGDWLCEDDMETVRRTASEIGVRGHRYRLPTSAEYEHHGIELDSPGEVRVFELCRYLAATLRDDVLATPTERRANVPDDLDEIILLDDWHHPDLVVGQRPSETSAMRLLAEVLVTGDPTRYRPVEPGNTHWSNWPDGGTL